MKTEINGFKIVRLLKREGNKSLYCIATCKVCGRDWLVRRESLKVNKSCGCVDNLKPLSNYINGFKIVKDLGIGLHEPHRRALVECKACGREYSVKVYKLKTRQSCGCSVKGVVVCKYIRTHPQLHSCFRGMLKRCYNPKSQYYYCYGGKGIRICDEWMADVNSFCAWSLANGFENNKRLSIDRIDNEKGYSPENCRWIPLAKQGHNHKGVKLSMDKARLIRQEINYISSKELAQKYGVKEGTIKQVVYHQTWKE